MKTDARIKSPGTYGEMQAFKSLDWVECFREGRCYNCGRQMLNAYGESVKRTRFNGQEQSNDNQHAAGRLRRYCSNACRQAAYRRKRVTDLKS